MTIVVLDFTLMISRLIRKAEKSGVISQTEAEYLTAMARHSEAATSTRALVSNKGAPDFPYAALYFSTMVWHSGDEADNDSRARAGYMLAQYVLSHESPGYDPYWAAKLLRDFYDAHADPIEHSIAGMERQAAAG